MKEGTPRDGDGAYRFERKFLVPPAHHHQVESTLRYHPARFYELYQERRVNSIYFDTLDFDHYRDNLDGVRERVKFRIRWYGPLSEKIEKATLELKIRNGALVRKLHHPFPSFELRHICSSSARTEIILSSKLPLWLQGKLKTLRPVLVCTYRRRYFLSTHDDVRCTTDWDLEYARIEESSTPLMGRQADLTSFILEVKYPTSSDTAAREITSRFPFRLARSSKYVRGVDILYGRI